MSRLERYVSKLKPEEKEFFKKIIPVLLQKFEFIEKEFNFDKTIMMDLTTRCLRLRVKPNKFLPKEVFRELAKKYGWKGAFILDDYNIKSPSDWLTAVFSSLLRDAGGSIWNVRKEHLEKIMEALRG